METMETATYLDELNEQQRAAVTVSEGYLRVIAGAGSGKTKLLVSRYVYLVDALGIDPSNILCVTFTNKAAGEMRSRIRALIGEGYDTSLISTYHGFCARLLREDSEKIAFPRNFEILDESAQKDILAQIYESRELKLDHASFEKILARIGAVKSSGEYITGFLTPGKCRILPAGTPVGETDGEILEQYLQKQKALFALDFDDLIQFALYMLENRAEVREKWQERLNYIQVDEFQDSSEKEMRLLDLLSGLHGNVMIVGDPDQNIYEWRGSDVRLLVDFDRTHVPTETVFLTRNYRSTPQILQCANTLIARNRYRIKKDLYTEAPAGMPVLHLHAKTYAEEMKTVCDRIETLRKTEGARFSDIAVLYRSSFLSRGVESALTERNIPYEIVGGVSFYQRMEIRDAVAYLRLAAEDDDAALERVINKPRRRFGRAKLAALKKLAEERGRPLLAVLRESPEEVPGGGGVTGFVSVVTEARAQLGKRTLAEITEELLTRSGYEAYIRELGDMERFENLTEFKRIVHDFERAAGERVTLPDFLQYMALQTGTDREKKEEDRVRLMTIHAAKGLEFPYVLLVGMTDGILPSSRSIEDRKVLGLEEERRLCYVAITRAMKGLFFTDSESGGRGSGVPSRFLFEMGEQHYVRVGALSETTEKLFRQHGRGRGSGGGAATASALPELHAPEELCGFGVVHPFFGFGTVEAYREKNDTYVVRFPRLKTQRNLAKEYLEKCRLLEPGSGEFARAEKAEAELAAKKETALEKTSAEPGLEKETAGEPETEPERTAGETIPEPGLEKETAGETNPREKTSQKETSLEETPQGEISLVKTPQEKTSLEETPLGEETSLEKASREKMQKELPLTKTLREETLFREENGPAERPAEKAITEPERCDLTEVPAERTLPEQALPKTGRRRPAKPVPLTDDPAETDLWKRSDVPHTGWQCIGITDLGSPCGICEMCGKQIIRYAHTMRHATYPKMLTAGCVCAGKMEGDPEAARERERSIKNLGARRENFLKREWKISRNGNEYLKIEGHLLVLVKSTKNGKWRFSFDGVFSEAGFDKRDRALLAAFDRLLQAERQEKAGE